MIGGKRTKEKVFEKFFIGLCLTAVVLPLILLAIPFGPIVAWLPTEALWNGSLVA